MTDAMHLYEEARSLHRAGRLEDAEGRYLAALAAESGHVGAMEWLGALYTQSGRFDEAVRWLEQAVRANPNSARFHANLGGALGKAGRPDEAVAAFEKALALAPGDLGIRFALGLALHQAGRHGAALPFLRRTAEQAPRSSDARIHLGHALTELGFLAEAVECFHQAVALAPERPQGHTGLGRALCGMQQPEAALDAFRRALAVDANFALAETGVGRAMMMLGRKAEARAAFERALALNPGSPHAYMSLLELGPFGADDPHLAALEALGREEDTLPHGERFDLHFALFKAYDALARREEAFAHLHKGNAIKRATIAYDEATVLGWFDAMAAAFAAPPAEAPGAPTDTPVFVVGMPRSGTTLVEQILASHPDVFGAGEMTAFETLTEELGCGLIHLPYDAAALPAPMLRRLGALYLERVRTLAPQAKRIVDKLPANFHYIGLIRLALPGARIIHVRRDAMDTCFSCYATAFEGYNLLWSYDLGETGRYHRAYDGLMAHWRKVLPPDAVLEVRYEDIVNDLEGQARRLIAHCGLDWTPACLDYYKTERAVATASIAQVRQPLYKSAIGRAAPYDPWLGPLRAALESP